MFTALPFLYFFTKSAFFFLIKKYTAAHLGVKIQAFYLNCSGICPIWDCMLVGGLEMPSDQSDMLE